MTQGTQGHRLRIQAACASGTTLIWGLRPQNLFGILEAERNAEGKKSREPSMKLIVAFAAFGLVSTLTAITPANAQKDPACIEKCNRENKTAGGSMPVRGTAERIRGCIAACPKAAKK
jgi:hypothetical protein